MVVDVDDYDIDDTGVGDDYVGDVDDVGNVDEDHVDNRKG